MSQVITFSKCSIGRHGGCSHDYHSFANSTMCSYTVALILHSTDAPTHTPRQCYTQTHTLTSEGWHNTWKHTSLTCVLCTFCEDNLWHLQLRSFTVYTMCSRKRNVYCWLWGVLFSLSPGRVSTCVKGENVCVDVRVRKCERLIERVMRQNVFSAKSKHWDVVCIAERLDFSVCWILPLCWLNCLTWRAGIRSLLPQDPTL